MSSMGTTRVTCVVIGRRRPSGATRIDGPELLRVRQVAGLLGVHRSSV
jgi:hypothetical protein